MRLNRFAALALLAIVAVTAISFFSMRAFAQTTAPPVPAKGCDNEAGDAYEVADELFIRQLAETYSDSHDIRLAEADYEAFMGHFDRAIQGYGELLEEVGSARQKARIVLQRLGANCRRSIPDGDLLVADFLTLWRFNEGADPSAGVKLLAVNTLVRELHSPASRDVLERLLAESDISPEAKAVIANKLEQLRRIEALAASLGE
jgi:hypothetical protein